MFEQLAASWPENEWLRQLAERAESAWRNHPHGDLPRWKKALAALPQAEQGIRAEAGGLALGAAMKDGAALRETLMQLHPWRKGPLSLGGQYIDTEWRSDWKWARVAPHIDVAGQRVLDIGCGNGYFGWRMLEDGARLVVGVDPTLLFVLQWMACRHFAGESANFVLPLGVENLPDGEPGFDTVFSMGVLYHRREPLRHLARIRSLLRTGGQLVLETLVLPRTDPAGMLVPESRYARMRNVWAVPGCDRLLEWVGQAGFREGRLVDVTPTTTKEQRSTDWMRFESLAQALDPDSPEQTIEGYPAPVRAVVIARR